MASASRGISPTEPYSDRLRRLFAKWNPMGMIVSDAKARSAVRLLADPRASALATPSELEEARWVRDTAVHPVLNQPIPSAFRACSFMPVTACAAIGLSSAGSAAGTIFWHWFYQSHSAATRYCNYADTTRDLDPRRMMGAYAASTAAACAIGVGALRVASLSPRLRAVSVAAPHMALGCAGALSTVLNNEPQLRDGMPLVDAEGRTLGLDSRAAAAATVARATLLQAVLVPSCALLAPTLLVRWLVTPRLWMSAPHLLPLAASATILGSVFVLTPLAVAAVPAHVPIAIEDLEDEIRLELQRRAAGDQWDGAGRVFSGRVLY